MGRKATADILRCKKRVKGVNSSKLKEVPFLFHLMLYVVSNFCGPTNLNSSQGLLPFYVNFHSTFAKVFLDKNQEILGRIKIA